MTSIDELEQLVNDYEKKINELKRLEKVFNGLNTKGFEEDALSIKQKLKNPKAVEQVRHEIEALQRKINSGNQKTMMTGSNESIKNLRDRLTNLQSKNADILIDDIEKKISNGKIKEASRLLDEREKSFNKFSTLSEELQNVKSKIRKLTDRVADGELDSEAYKRALDDFEAQKKEVEEQLWKLRNKLFKDDYEKPF